MRRLQTIAIFAGCILLLAALIWRQSYLADKAELRRLYVSGSGGDLENIERLSKSRSSEAVRLLEKLAQDGRAFGNARVAATMAVLRQNSMRTENSAIPCRDGCPIQVISSPSNAKNLSRGTRAVYLYILRMEEP